MPFYSTKSKLKRKLIAKESNQPLNIGGGDGSSEEETIEEFTYRESSLIDTILIKEQFFKDILILGYSKKFRSYTAELPLKFTSVDIEQDNFNVVITESSDYNVYPNKTPQELVNDGDISVKWFMDGTEVVGENEATLPLDSNNGDQGKNVYLEVTDFNNNVFTSNTITAQYISLLLLDNFDNNTLNTDNWITFGNSYGTIDVNASDECVITNNSGSSDDVIGIATKDKFSANTYIKARVKNISGRHSAIIGFGESTYRPYPHGRSGIGCTWYSRANPQSSYTSLEDENGTTEYGTPATQDLTSYQDIILWRESESIIKMYRNGTLEQTFDNKLMSNIYSFYFSADGYTKPNTIVIDSVEIHKGSPF